MCCLPAACAGAVLLPDTNALDAAIKMPRGAGRANPSIFSFALRCMSCAGAVLPPTVYALNAAIRTVAGLLGCLPAHAAHYQFGPALLIFPSILTAFQPLFLVTHKNRGLSARPPVNTIQPASSGTQQP